MYSPIAHYIGNGLNFRTDLCTIPFLVRTDTVLISPSRPGCTISTRPRHQHNGGTLSSCTMTMSPTSGSASDVSAVPIKKWPGVSTDRSSGFEDNGSYRLRVKTRLDQCQIGIHSFICEQ